MVAAAALQRGLEQTHEIFRLFFLEATRLVAAGLALGLIGAFALRQVIETQVYGVRPLDPLVLIPVTALLAGVALTACVWPARQATKVQLATVLSD